MPGWNCIAHGRKSGLMEWVRWINRWEESRARACSPAGTPGLPITGDPPADDDREIFMRIGSSVPGMSCACSSIGPIPPFSRVVGFKCVAIRERCWQRVGAVPPCRQSGAAVTRAWGGCQAGWNGSVPGGFSQTPRALDLISVGVESIRWMAWCGLVVPGERDAGVARAGSFRGPLQHPDRAAGGPAHPPRDRLAVWYAC